MRLSFLESLGNISIIFFQVTRDAVKITAIYGPWLQTLFFLVSCNFNLENNQFYLMSVFFFSKDLQESLNGGWLDQSGDIVDAFADYADFCFKTFGDKVKFWITFNEPYITAQLGETILFLDKIKV